MTACFVTGTALAYWNRNRKAGKVGESIFGGILILCGMLLGGYPIYSAPRGLYQLLNHEIFRIPSYMLWHSIGSGLTFVGIILCPAVQRGLSIRPLIEAGKLSFAVYLSHIAVMSSVGTGLAVLLIDSGLSYGGLCWMVFAAVCVTVFVFSWLFHRYVEHGCEQLAGRLMRILRVPEGEKTCHSA